ncbi:MAG: prepilin-type N-terminal cleavage/methylation domain-containing protein [Candidatus Paceibacteria bacterium]|jgi:prepilin-type N-terminal cleavage/methylation domain-containing protein
MKLEPQGFTLIELLVVISIIGLLASVALGSLSDARNTALYTAVKSDIRLIHSAFYATDQPSSPIKNITGSGCSVCVCWDLGAINLRSLDENSPCRDRWRETIDRITLASDLLQDSSDLYRDPWGSPYLLDENEMEFSTDPCRRDSLSSVGEDGLRGTADDYIFLLPFRTSLCR